MKTNSGCVGLLAAGLLVVAGCGGKIGNTTGTGTAGVSGTGTAGASATGTAGASATGTAGASATGTAGASATGTAGATGAGGSTTACTPLGTLPRRLWRLSVEQWGAAVKDLLGLTTAPILSNRGGEATYAFFGDATLGVDADFQFALYQSSQNDVLPAIASKITTLAPCTGTTATAQRTCAMTFAQTMGAKAFRRPLDTT